MIRYFPGDNAETLYLKLEPLDLDTWGNGIITMTADGSLDLHKAAVDPNASYQVFVRAGATPASSDLNIGAITPVPDNASIAATKTTAEAAADDTQTIIGLINNLPEPDFEELLEAIKANRRLEVR